MDGLTEGGEEAPPGSLKATDLPITAGYKGRDGEHGQQHTHVTL